MARRISFLALLVAILLADFETAFAAGRCELAFGVDLLLRELPGARRLDTWAEPGLTDPRAHDPARFRYFVHTVDVTRPGTRRLLADPDAAFRNERLYSLSLIDERHPHTFHNRRPSFGFLIEPDRSRIVATSLRDFGSSRFLRPKNLTGSARRMNGAQPVKSPDQLMDATRARNGRNHNEIIVFGSPEARIAGAFVNVKAGRTLEEEIQVQRALQTPQTIGAFDSFWRIIRERDLPVIPIFVDETIRRGD